MGGATTRTVFVLATRDAVDLLEYQRAIFWKCHQFDVSGGTHISHTSNRDERLGPDGPSDLNSVI